MKTKVTTIVASPGGAVKRRVWDYECSPMRRAFGGLASRTVREGGVVVSLGDGAAVNRQSVAEWLAKNGTHVRPCQGPSDVEAIFETLDLMVKLANEVLRTGGTLREDVQEHNTQEEI